MSTGISMGNVAGLYLIRATLTPAATAANTVIEQAFTAASTGNNIGLNTLRVGDFVSVNAPSHTNGVGVVNARVSAAGTISIAFSNNTAGSLTAPAGVYTILVERAESLPLPTSIAD